MDTVQLNNLIEGQEKLGLQLKTILTNIKKDSPSRKTAKYITDRKAGLRDVIRALQENHDLLKDDERLRDHTYITADYFSSVMDLYNEAIYLLSQSELKLKEESNLVPEKTSLTRAEEGSTSKQNVVFEPVQEVGINQANSKLGMQKFRISQLERKLTAAKQSLAEDKSSWMLRATLEGIQKQWDIIEMSHMELFVEGTCISDRYFTEMKFEELQEDYETVSCQLLTKINEATESHKESKLGVRLPKLAIPIFSGEYESWYSFRDLFRTMIHKEPTLTSTEKMQYLKTHVRGEPSRMIQHLCVSESNYIAAWELLTKRYDNERLIISKFIDKMLDLPKIERPEPIKLKNMFDLVNESIAGLNNQGVDTKTWDQILIRIIARKWDSETNNIYELSLSEPSKQQTFDSMMEFMSKRFKCLESANNATNVTKGYSQNRTSFNKPGTSQGWVAIQGCWYCNKRDHNIYQCTHFKALPVRDRISAVSYKKICVNCISHYATEKCKSAAVCNECGKYHHSMLHIHNNSYNNNYNKPTVSHANNGRQNIKPTSSWKGKTPYRMNSHVSVMEPGSGHRKTTVLATALAETITYHGETRLLRILCDQGSEASFCTEEVAQMLSYPREKMQIEIKGIGDEKPKTSKCSIFITLKPRFPSAFRLPVSLIVLPKLTSALPKQDVPQICSHNLGVRMTADPTYYKKGPIDVILGAQEYSKLLLGGLEKIEDGILAQNTEFGWIFSGWRLCNQSNQLKIMSMSACTEEVKQLTKFWELEEIQEKMELKEEDVICEDYYKRTTERNTDGSYTVRIPFKNRELICKESRHKAAARLFQLEKMFEKNTSLQKQYIEFMTEYEEMGHMKKVKKSEYGKGSWYIPHHGVVREDRLTTKLRVVYDASSKSKGQVSLNENMYKGPRLQQDLTTILMRWRKHKVAWMADIEKMYRFIKVNKDDLKFQRILWRKSPNDPIDEYELTTVTYGTSAAPYLAVRTLQQLALDEQENYPLASKITLQDFFVDDLLSGAQSIKEAKGLQNELIAMLKSGGFNLRKWSSNKEEILDNIPEELREDMVKLPQHETRKSLGVMWSPLQDTFQFKVNVTSMDSPTKRFILSEISKIFDPMGWLAPVIVRMKMLIQELWTNGSEWDKPVDSSTKKKWVDFQQQIGSVESIRIPRWTQYTGTEVELHGFADASELAYGAVIYSRVKINGRYYVTLLQAKSKVTPKKGKTTLPRLELCAANLLAKLMEKVKSGLDCEHVTSYCWTDSMITLGWIKGESGKWQTFVANRVTEIQKLVGSENWGHVKSADNAADVLSRGIEPNKLESHGLWWNGPSWLQDEKLPISKTLPEICQEIEMSHHIIIDEDLKQEKIWERFSKLQRMIRVLSYCYRLIHGNKAKSELVSYGEMVHTMWRIIRVIQKQSMPEEYEALQKKQCVKKSSKLSSLDPFIGEDNIMRVGGRLEHSQLPYDQKHPIILPYKHHVSALVIRDAHERTLHGGNKLTLAYIRQKYWIIGVKKMIKKQINKCVTCIRYKASTPDQKMGQLPAPRVNPSQTFTHTGVDYAGPIQVRTTKGRGNKSTKGYIAVFVCLATKAIHLELVGDLTTESFIAALTRFKSRRGHVAHLYSDNGKTFVGAAMLLYTELLQITQSPQFQSAVANMGTRWHFIPPLSPSMGGIWEAGVKSMKHHIKRVIGNSTLTYEELTTLLSQVEACLNSRPLCAQSEDIEDGIILTPSHFLIGRESVGIPDPIVETNMDLQGRWKLIQKMKKDLWKSWTRDYLSELQQRHKWKFDQENLQIGTVVIIKDENITPSKWPLAKIKETHIGSDGKVRVVTLQKASGTCLKRSLHSVIPIPSQHRETRPLDRCEPTLRQADNTKNKVTLDGVVSGVSCNMTRIARDGHNVNRRQRNTSSSGVVSRMLWFTIMIGLFHTTYANYTIKSIEEGIYVEQIGTATIDRGVFRIQANFDKESIKTDISHVRGVVSQFKQFCEKTKRSDDDIHCTQLYQHLYEEQLKLEKSEEAIMNPGYVREKRGLFGQLLTSVFGVNDEVYKDIDTLHTNQNKLIEAANHQTKIMISTIAAVNETEERIATKLGRVQTNLNQAIDYINKANVWYKKIDQNWLHIHVLNMYQLAVNYITEIEEHYAGLLQVSMHQGTIYNVLKIKEIRQIISNANTKLPAKLKIVPNQLIQTKSAENANHIQVYGYFVIQDVSKYTLMHVTPVPKIDKSGRLYSIEIYHSITGIDYNNENYFELSKEEFRSCLRKGNEYICYPMSIKNMQTNRNCVNDLLFKKTEAIECNTRLLNKTSTIWKQLYMANTWLVITTKPVKASIVCDGEREEVTMQATSVVHISENCIIKTRNNMLAARRMSTVQVLATYTKKANFSLNTNISTSLIKDMARDEEVLDSSRDLFRHLANKESALQTELDRTIWQQIQTHSLTVTKRMRAKADSHRGPVDSGLPYAAEPGPVRRAPPKPERQQPKGEPAEQPGCSYEMTELRPIQPLHCNSPHLAA